MFAVDNDRVPSRAPARMAGHVAQREALPSHGRGHGDRCRAHHKSLIIQMAYEWVKKFTLQVQGEQSAKMHVDPCKIHAVRSSVVPIHRRTHNELCGDRSSRPGRGVPDKKALAALKEAKRKLDELYRDVTSRRAGVLDSTN